MLHMYIKNKITVSPNAKSNNVCKQKHLQPQFFIYVSILSKQICRYVDTVYVSNLIIY